MGPVVLGDETADPGDSLTATSPRRKEARASLSDVRSHLQAQIELLLVDVVDNPIAIEVEIPKEAGVARFFLECRVENGQILVVYHAIAGCVAKEPEEGDD